MVTFLMILSGLIVLNVILLKYSAQSVDGNKKTVKKQKAARSSVNIKEKDAEIAEAA